MAEVKLKVGELTERGDFGRGIIRMSAKSMKELGISQGDVIEIEGKRKTPAIAVHAYPSDAGLEIIRMDGLVRRNAKTGIGEIVTLRKAEVKEATSVTIAPARANIILQVHGDAGMKKNLFMRPLNTGDIILPNPVVKQQSNDIFESFFGMSDIFTPFGEEKFVVISTEPKGYVQVTEATELELLPEATMPLEEGEITTVTYEDIGGLDKEMQKVREMIELPMRHPEIFARLGIEPPKGVLLHGPPGTGKTLIARAVANESGATFIPINGPELVSKFYGQSEENFRKMFEQAEKNAPAIIFIDEIDAIAPKRDEVSGEVERRIVSQILTLMDGLKSRGKVIVLAATNRPNSIDPALRRPGRFDREIEIGVPDKKGREQILQIHTRGMPMDKTVKLKKIADLTYGYVGADLSAVSKEAAMHALRRAMPDLGELKGDEPLSEDTLKKLVVNEKDFDYAMRMVEPSAMREVLIEKPKIGWNDIGGLEEVKNLLKESVEWPLKCGEDFERMGIKPPRGVLLYGPPGTGKTLLARAVAKESDANFILVNAGSLLSKWVGESLPENENVFILDNDGLPQRIPIGNIVNDKQNVDRDVKVVTFDKNMKVKFSRIKRYIKHKFDGNKLYEITTSTGRKIRTTPDHSLFTMIGGRLGSVPASHLIVNESYILIPKKIPPVGLDIRHIDLLKKLEKNDYGLYVRNASEYIKKAKNELGAEKTAKLLDINKKYLYDVIRKNIAVRISLFIKLMRYANIKFNSEMVTVSTKMRNGEIPALMPLDKDMLRLLGVLVAEGDMCNYGVRIHNQNKEIRDIVIKACNNLGLNITVTKELIFINSKAFRIFLENVLDFKRGAKNKNIPDLIFALKKSLISEFLRGYYSGDGTIHGNYHRYVIEAGTESKKLADDLMHLLLYFGIVVRKYEKKEKNGNISYRILFMGVDNFKKFKEIGFIDKKRMNKINNYIKTKKWSRSEQIPMDMELMKLVKEAKCQWSSSLTIGKNILRQILNKVDPSKKLYKLYWKLVDGEVFFDKIKSIRKISYTKGFVYDISVNPTENFMAGFGGIFAHNSEKHIREIFHRAKQVSPAIIFFDEIDALAPKRGGHNDSGVSERIVSQMLTEMSGLEDLHDVIVIAATNRPDMLDTALLRPGRFDRQILVPTPDSKARKKIFEIHTKNMPLADDVNLDELVKKTDNYTGADIENICREAAMVALRDNMKVSEIKKQDFDTALEKIAPSVSKEVSEAYRKMMVKKKAEPTDKELGYSG
jgi:transitional endoplasmic reticulum ATPase